MTALVLGGGGVTGIAWELGVVAGLAEKGVDLVAPELIIGTSAGSTVAAQITSGRSIDELVVEQRREDSAEIAVDIDIDLMVEWLTVLGDTSLTDEERRARVGAIALAADTVSEEVRRTVIAARLPEHEWPAQPMEVTAVDAETGVFHRFDRHSGVSLVDAVAASCAVPGVWPPVTIDGRRYVDGGIRSTTNADLAEGHDRVVVLSPIPAAQTPALDRELAVLRGAGALVEVVSADEVALEAMGDNPLDPAARPAAVEAGREQGSAAAGGVGAVWG